MMPRTAVPRSAARARIVALAVGALLIAWTSSAWAAAGDLDPSFSRDGKLWERWIGTFGLDEAVDVAVQPDGKIVTVGTAYPSSGNGWYFAVVRYNSDGTRDSSFDGDGGVVTDLDEMGFAFAVAVQLDGKIVVGGEGPCALAQCFALVRYNPNGSIDTSFGKNGHVRTMFADCGCTIFDLALQRDGKIVAVGYRFRYGDHQDDDLFAIARYNPNGTLDSTFSGDGRAAIDFGYGDDLAYSVAVQPDGKILAAGMGTVNLYTTGSDFAVARFHPNGTLDRTFSGDGLKTVNLASARYDAAAGVALAGDGDIVLAGRTAANYWFEDPRIALVRLTPGGARDSAFSGDGRLITNPGSNGGWANAVAVAGGKVLVAGGRPIATDDYVSDWIVARYTSGGALDSSFSGDGIAVTDWGTGEDSAGSLAVQSDGRIVVVGSVYATFGVARYLAA